MAAEPHGKSFEEEVQQQLLDLSLRLQEAHARQVHHLRTENAQLRQRCSQPTYLQKTQALACSGNPSEHCWGSAVMEELPLQPPASKTPRTLLTKRSALPFPGDVKMVIEETPDRLPLLLRNDDDSSTCDDGASYSAEALQRWKGMMGRLQLYQIGLKQAGPSPTDDELAKLIAKATVDQSKQSRDNGYLQHLVARPTSFRRMFWDCGGFFLIFYDMITLPVVEVFKPKLEIWYHILEMGSVIYWQLDLLSQFLVGFYSEGVLEMRPRWTAWHYLVGWFPFDFIVVALDWYFTVVQGNDQGTAAMRVGKAGKMARLVSVLHALRAIRLLRIWKYRESFGEARGLFTNEFRLIVFRLVRLAVVVLMLNHFVACLWFAVGSSLLTTHQDRTWVAAAGLENAPVLYQYSTSLHWAITQFTPASMEVHPTNVYERTFAICIVIFGLLGFSSVISSITGLMLQIRNFGAAHNERKAVLRKYLAQNKISLELSQQLWNSIRTITYAYEARVKEDEVELLCHVPESIRGGLREEVFLPVIVRHPLFRALTTLDSLLAFEVSSQAMCHTSVHVDHEVFKSGSEVQLTFVASGVLTYSSHQTRASTRFRASIADVKSQPSDSGPGHVLKDGDWMCEACLWTSWVPCGVAVASSMTELFQMKTQKFHELVDSSPPQSRQAVARYGAYFVALLHEVGIGYASGMTDIAPNAKEVEELVTKSFKIKEEATVYMHFAKHLQGLQDGFRPLFMRSEHH